MLCFLLHGKWLRNAVTHLSGTESVSLCPASRDRQKTSVRVMEEVPAVSSCSHRPETWEGRVPSRVNKGFWLQVESKTARVSEKRLAICEEERCLCLSVTNKTRRYSVPGPLADANRRKRGRFQFPRLTTLLWLNRWKCSWQRGELFLTCRVNFYDYWWTQWSTEHVLTTWNVHTTETAAVDFD